MFHRSFMDFSTDFRSESPYIIAWFSRKILNHTTARRKVYKKNSKPCDEQQNGLGQDYVKRNAIVPTMNFSGTRPKYLESLELIT